MAAIARMTAAGYQQKVALMADHVSPPRPLVQGPTAWVGAELARRPEEWTYQLSPADHAEVAAATRICLGRDIATITRSDFPLPIVTLKKRFKQPRRPEIRGTTWRR